ncbi:pilus assembly protein TadG-related protein [Streptomyces laurentii]|uniref:pilus assembly protein TadG-related protein n=1 Tax=Streptomyces laurentii TaxID=39478 RepID=UPI0036C6946E
MLGARGGDTGQAFPVYITVIAGLLFLAFVYLAVGQAASVRNEGQTAADAAALAAAQDAREQLRDGWLRVLGEPDEWGAFLNGEEYSSSRACQEAARFAAENGAALDGPCEAGPGRGGGEEFRVWIRTNDSVGRSSVPGTEGQHAKATATAVLEPLCTFTPPEQTPSPPPTSPSSSSPSPSEEPTATPSPEPEPITGLHCRDLDWTIDPENPRLPSVADLFTVRLVD